MLSSYCSFCKKPWKTSYLKDDACYYCGNDKSLEMITCPHCHQLWGLDWKGTICLLCSGDRNDPPALNKLLQISREVEATVSSVQHRTVCGACLADWQITWGDICRECGNNTHVREPASFADQRIVADNHRGVGTQDMSRGCLVICHDCLNEMEGFANGHSEILIGLDLIRQPKNCDLCRARGEWLYFTVEPLDKAEEKNSLTMGV